MATEAYRGLLRILGNYGRLAASLALGLIYVPIFLLWLGEEAFGLLTLMGASVGIAAMATEISRKSMLRELAAAHHGTDEAWFRSVYNSSFVVSLAAAGITTLGFAILLACLPLLEIPPHLGVATWWLVVGQAFIIITRIIMQPAINMYVVHERFFLSNLWMVIRKASHLATALLLIYGFQITEPASALIAFSITLAGIQTLITAVQVVMMLIIDRRLMPHPSTIRRDAIWNVTQNFGMQTFVTLAMNIHERIAQVIVNLVFGPVGNTIYGVSLRLSAYSRMVTMGATGGLETVSARLGASSQSAVVKDLLYHTTRLHTAVSVPAGLAIFILAEPVLWHWVGHALDDPHTSIPIATTVVQILMFALVSRAISDGWIAVMYGTGHLKRYALVVIAGGLANPVITIVLISMLPAEMKFNGPAIAFAAILTGLHLFGLPVIVARCFDVTYSEVVKPMLRPSAVAVVLSPILVYGSTFAYTSIWWLGATLAAYGAAYAVGGWLFTLTMQERRRFSSAAMRRISVFTMGNNVTNAP